MSLTIYSPFGKIFLPSLRDVDISITDNYYAFTIGNLHPDSDSMDVFEKYPHLIDDPKFWWSFLEIKDEIPLQSDVHEMLFDSDEETVMTNKELLVELCSYDAFVYAAMGCDEHLGNLASLFLV